MNPKLFANLLATVITLCFVLHAFAEGAWLKALGIFVVGLLVVAVLVNFGEIVSFLASMHHLLVKEVTAAAILVVGDIGETVMVVSILCYSVSVVLLGGMFTVVSYAYNEGLKKTLSMVAAFFLIIVKGEFLIGGFALLAFLIVYRNHEKEHTLHKLTNSITTNIFDEDLTGAALLVIWTKFVDTIRAYC
ncbi:OLC1v1003334C1 [Oldenlandia corymbosa var. corymbosa]|uniref:OLC1v1003334C1 n=1 Tax=Oldenlandia corymbosa var. corymbosa TaxID=529605 RepID=A0AAV1DCT4_OLDCO|nr:OLC1v1003334C1 [Oldenlandia corymbosa var. corymbosa]